MTPDIRALAGAWDAVVRRHLPGGVRLVTTAAKARSVLRAGATEAAIAETEARLGTRLPPTYRAFLSVSDGAYADSHGAVTNGEATFRQHSSVPGLGFLAVADLRWLHEAEPLVVEAMTMDAGDGTALRDDGSPVTDTRPLREHRALLISSVTDSQLVALVPIGDRAEWELWAFTRDDIIGFHSFGSWLQHACYEPGVDAVMELIRWTVDGDSRGLGLYKVSDAATLPYLVAAIDEFPDSVPLISAATSALSRIRTDAAVGILETRFAAHPDKLRRRSGLQALTVIGSPSARAALERLGAWSYLMQLDDPRTGPVAFAAFQGGELPAAQGMAKWPEPRFVPTLLAKLTTAENPSFRFDISAALFACGAPEGKAELERIAASDHWSRRAAEALLESGRET